MKINDVLNKYSISEATLKNWEKLGYISNISDIKESEITKIIRSKKDIRRNKRNSTEHIIPVSYVKDRNIPNLIIKIMNLQNEYNVSNNEILIETIKNMLDGKNIPSEVFDILGMESDNKEFIDKFSKINISYNKNDDFLGCLYMSLISKGKKDTKGIFYTPFSVVKKIVDSMTIYQGMRILDPGCGSGNFLIQMYRKLKDNDFSTDEIIDMLYGYDIDNIAVLIAKINLYNIDNNIDYNSLNIKKFDFFKDTIDDKFDTIIGNPPWGMKYTKKEKDELKERYGKIFVKQDSFAQFIIRSFEVLSDNGELGFVLPSSILNIATHKYIREVLLSHNINYIKNMGREFNEVVTDVVIIKVTNSNDIDNKCIFNKYKIKQRQFLENPNYNFLVPSTIPKNIINKIKNTRYFHLNDTNSLFNLGIVTGNNKEFLFDKKIAKAEPVISGKDITRYNLNYKLINKYIIFDKDKMQQVAPEENYRKEKLVYKFIGNKLCFAVDSKGLLTLNSANIINISGYNIYYVSAILNSRVTQLFFDEVYKTHKVLKNDIKSFYIFDFDNDIKNKIIELSKNSKDNKYNEEIESIIYNQLSLSNEEIEYLISKY